MPELPEIEALKRNLQPRIEGHLLVSVQLLHDRPCRPIPPAEVEDQLRGLRLFRLERRAKYLVFHWVTGNTATPRLLVHLGMTGSLAFSTNRPTPRRHVVAWMEWDHGFLTFEDPRRFGLFTTNPWLLERLGPEPLSPEFTPEALSRIGDSRQAIKVRLMDASQVAGIGNIYASEILHRAGISPRRRADRIRTAEWTVLHGATRGILEEAIQRNLQAYESGGSPYYHEAGTRGTRPDDTSPFQVYDREEESCLRCGTPIRRCEQGGRSTYWCPGCQT